MKYRDPKTGEVFENIKEACNDYCEGRGCDSCAFDEFGVCAEWAETNPTEATHLIGLEVITDKEEPMEKKDKPISEWTMEEMQSYCSERNGNCSDDCKFSRGGIGLVCKVALKPRDWDLTSRPRFTQEEVAVLRAVKAAYPWAKYIVRSLSGLYFSEQKPTFTTTRRFARLPDKLFPSIQPGQTFSLEDFT